MCTTYKTIPRAIRACLLVFFIAFWLNANAKLITYPAPKGIALSTSYAVKVRQGKTPWQMLAVYNANVAHTTGTHTLPVQTSFAYFDTDSKAEVEITVNGKTRLNAVKVRPAKYGITPQVKGNKITITANPKQTISIEIDGDIYNNLQLFANEIDLTPLPKDTSKLVYFGPGIHYMGSRPVHSGETIYIAGGAVVLGSLVIDHAENVRIAGHGILTQIDHELPPAPDNQKALTKPGNFRGDEILISFSKNVVVDGLCVLPHKYSVLMGNSDNVSIRNFKSFSSEGNADGIDIFCSKNISLDHIFMRNSDDCIAIYGHRWKFYGNTTDVRVANAVLWADVAHPVLIGTHGDTEHPDTLEKMKFSNLTVLDQHENQMDYQGCIALNAGDSNLLRDMSFEDIEVEQISKGQLVNLRVMYNHKYNTSPGRAIENILFKNLSYKGEGTPLSLIVGYDDIRDVKNIRFINLKIGDMVISDDMKNKPGFYKTGDMANIFIGEHVNNIRFLKD